MVRLAQERGIISASVIDIREFATDHHRTVDDRPYGGGDGMVLLPEPLGKGINAVKKASPDSLVALLTPQGRPFDQAMAAWLATKPGLILICGRYEGVDDRVSQTCVDIEISIGDFILTGGELGAMIVIDATTRLLEGVLGGETSVEKESFSTDRLEHAHYTRPQEFQGIKVPEILLKGHHARIDAWRKESALIRTLLKRPDLLNKTPLTENEREIAEIFYKRLEKLLYG